MDDVGEIEDTSPTSILPDEILSRIFVSLPLVDRESVRLVCRSWYNCCTCVNITKHERFVFRTGSRIEDVNAVISRSTHSLLDLEFQGLPVSDLPAHFWKACSQRIRVLRFHKCPLNDKTISNIILHCENLTSFHVPTSFREPRCIRYVPTATDEGIFSGRLVDELIKKGIRRPNLHTLSILMSLENVQEGVLSKICLIYPCIRHFNFGVGESVFIYCHPRAIADLYLNLDQCLNPDTPLESLTCDVPTRGKWMETFINTAGQGLRLKRLETRLFLNRSTKDVIFNFFKLQRNLEVVRLEIMHPMKLMESNDEDEIKALFFHILESCPNLREFQLDTSLQYILIKYSEVPRFLTSISKLNFLSLNCRLSGSLTNVQFNLTTLRWVSLHNPDSSMALLQRCASLQHLHLSYCGDTSSTDATLQIIFQYLPGLQTLVVDGTENFTDFGFTGRDVDGNKNGYSIKSLHQLKCLDLRTYAFEFKMTEKTILEFQLPRLESLSLTVRFYDRLLEKTLSELASHLPELKELAIPFYRNDEHFMEKTIQFCKGLKSLHRLMIHPLWEEGFEDFYKELSKGIFSSCKRLRYMSWSNKWVSFRDPFTGEMLHKDWNIFKFPKNIFDQR